MTEADPSVTETRLPPMRPGPFCGEGEDLEVIEAGGLDSDNPDVCVACQACEGQGPVTRVGCRDDEELDLWSEAIDLWNTRRLGVVA